MRHCFVVLFLWVAGIKKIRGRNTNLVAVSPFTLTMNVMLTGKEHVEGTQGSSQSHRQCKSTGTLQYLYLQRRLLPSRLILCLLSKPQFLLKISQVEHKKTYAVWPYNCFWYLHVAFLISHMENSAVATRLEKVSFHSNAKEFQTTTQLHSSHTLAKYCSKFSKPGFNTTWIVNFQMFKLDLEKAEEAEIKLPTSVGSSKTHRRSRKTFTSALLTMSKSLTVWITTNCGKFFKRWEYQTPLPASWEICMQVKKQQLELDMEQQTGSI